MSKGLNTPMTLDILMLSWTHTVDAAFDPLFMACGSIPDLQELIYGLENHGLRKRGHVLRRHQSRTPSQVPEILGQLCQILPNFSAIALGSIQPGNNVCGYGSASKKQLH